MGILKKIYPETPKKSRFLQKKFDQPWENRELGACLTLKKYSKQKEIHMNKGQLVEAVQKKLGKDTSKASAEAALNAVIASITKAVKKEPVQIIGFGTFSVVKRAARKGINPQTREPIKIKASKSVKFKPGAKLKAAI